MIIIRYLVRETLKSQLAILFILLLIFFCQKLVRILGAAVDGDIPTNLVLSLLGLGIPVIACAACVCTQNDKKIPGSMSVAGDFF